MMERGIEEGSWGKHPIPKYGPTWSKLYLLRSNVRVFLGGYMDLTDLGYLQGLAVMVIIGWLCVWVMATFCYD